jgi:hypothetical protein
MNFAMRITINLCLLVIPQARIKVKLLGFRERHLIAVGIVSVFTRIAIAILVRQHIAFVIVGAFPRKAMAILECQLIAVVIVCGTKGKVKTECHENLCWFIIPRIRIKVKLLGILARQHIAVGIVGAFPRIAFAIHDHRDNKLFHITPPFRKLF